MREGRQKTCKELKTAMRKNKRLKERARHLSEEDMVQILVMKRNKSESASASTSCSEASSSTTPMRDGMGDASTAVSANVIGDEDQRSDRKPSDDEMAAED